MFSLYNLNLQHKVNGEILLADYQPGTHYSLICLYESSSSSDTGCITLIEQNNNSDGNIKIRKLVWISDSAVSGMSINPTCDWLSLTVRGGLICILPVGTLMGRIQKRNEHWKSNDVTYLPNKLKLNSKVTCMKWWTTFKEQNMCIIGKTDGDVLIVNLANGTTLFSERFPDYISSIDLLQSTTRHYSYCIVTTKILNQWKLLLEEDNETDPVIDIEFGFEALNFPYIKSSSIINLRSSKKSKEKIENEAYLPFKLYQFPQSTFLKSQYYSGKSFLGAYDRSNGKYKLYESTNLETALFEYQLPQGVLDVTITEDLIYLVVGSKIQQSTSQSSTEVNSTTAIWLQEVKPLKLCILLRQYAHSHLVENNKFRIPRKPERQLYKQSISTVLPKSLTKSLLVEFELPNLTVNDDILCCVNLTRYFNFNLCMRKSGSALSPNIISQSMPPPINSTSGAGSNSAKTIYHDYMQTLRNNVLISKWLFSEPKYINPLLVIGSTGVSVCCLSQCLEDKFIDHLLADDVKRAEWLGVGLRLDMNSLYRYTVHLLVTRSAQPLDTVVRSTKNLIVEFLDLASAKMSYKLNCLISYLSAEGCLQHCLTLLPQINKCPPRDRTFLSNAMIPLFGKVMSDPLESVDKVHSVKRNRYYDKFRRFVVNNCFFNDFKATKTLISFGLIEEAFFIAKQKGCVMESFSYLMENKFCTNWPYCLEQSELRKRYIFHDQDYVLRYIGITELDIVARSNPKLIRTMAEFITSELCRSYKQRSALSESSSNVESSKESISNVFQLPPPSLSFKTSSHLCCAFNPFSNLIDTMFRIITSMYGANNTFGNKGGIDYRVQGSFSLMSSIDSISDVAAFSSENLLIRREMGPVVLAYCFLVTCRDNQLLSTRDMDFLYFINLYYILLSTNKLSEKSGTSATYPVEQSPFSLTAAEDEFNTAMKNESFESILHLLSKSKSFKPKKNILSPYWTKRVCNQLLEVRDNFCVSVSVFEVDLFDDDDDHTPQQHHQQINLKYLLADKSNASTTNDNIIGASKSNLKCQINMLGFQNERNNRILLLPKEIECGREIVRQLALGKQHMLILCDNGAVYAAGNNDYGQLGIEDGGSISYSLRSSNDMMNSNSKRKSIHESGEMKKYSKDNRLTIVHPTAVNLELGKNEQIVAVAAGDYHSGALIASIDKENDENADGNVLENSSNTINSLGEVIKNQRSHVYTWGWGVHGQLGHGDIDDQRLPKVLCFKFNRKNSMSDSLDDENGKLINGSDRKISEEYPVQLEMGCYHSIILTNQGTVYGFGNNSFGQLGLCGVSKCLKPRLIKNLPPNVTLIGTRYCHTVCVTEQNEIFTWGIHPTIWPNASNQMKSHTDLCTPLRIDSGNLLNNEKVIKISCGSNHTILLTENRLVYSFGSNMSGQLGLGNRREVNSLAEVKMSRPVDFVSTDDGITVVMNISEKSTNLYTWGRCSHNLIQEHVRGITSDTLTPLLLAEYQHIYSSNVVGDHCFGVDTVNSGNSNILNKQQLMVVLLNFSKFLDRRKFISIMTDLHELDIIADYFLVNEMIVESFFWRIKSLKNRINLYRDSGKDVNGLKNDVKAIFKFYIRLSRSGKYIKLEDSVIYMVTGFFKYHNFFWDIYEKLVLTYLDRNLVAFSKLYIRYQLENHVSGHFIRELFFRFANFTTASIDSIQSADLYLSDNVRTVSTDTLSPSSMRLEKLDISNLLRLLATEDSDTVYDAADDHKVVVFAQCGHAYRLTHFKDIHLRPFLERLRRRQLSLSGQAIHRLYSDSSILPECIECFLAHNQMI